MNTTQSILPFYSFLFSEIQFKIYGTHNEPLFLVNDIVCGLLGMDKINSDWFFRENKNNEQFIMRCELLTSCPELQERFKKSNKDYIYFFTEDGLVECLILSRNERARAFRTEIRNLLKGIRKGEYEILQREHDRVVKELQRCQRKCELYKLFITDKNGRVVGIYGGASVNSKRRHSQHMSNSSNPAVKRAIS